MLGPIDKYHQTSRILFSLVFVLSAIPYEGAGSQIGQALLATYFA